MSENPLIGIAPLTTLAASFLMPVIHYATRGSRRVLELASIVASLVPLIISAELFRLAYSSDAIYTYKFGGWPPPIGIVYVLDKLNAALALITTFLMFLIAIYSNEYLAERDGLSWYYTLYFGLETGLLGVLLTGDVFNLFVMIEVTSVASYALVMFYRYRGESIAAGLKYAFVGSLGTTIYFLALGIVYSVYGTLNLFDLAAKVRGHEYPYSGAPVGDVLFGTAVALVLITWTFAIKAGVFPNHFWLPDAHPAAPTPISAILSGLVVNVGAYAMFRYVYNVFGGELSTELNVVLGVISTILLIIGSLSAIVGSLLMHIQRDVKRLIAYSTVMHMGYLFMAIGARNDAGSAAFALHMFNHSVAKAALFLAAGVFIYAAGSRRLEDLSGLGSRHPLATIALTIASLNLAGIPPLPVFYSKLLTFYAVFEISSIYGLVVVITSAIALIAYVKLVYAIILGRRAELSLREVPRSMSLALLALAIAMISTGVGMSYVMEYYVEPLVVQVRNVNNYIVMP